MGSCGLNHAYRVVFNESLGAWVAVPESARSRFKRGRAAVLATVAAVLLGGALAGGPAAASGPVPTGGQVVAGSGTITQAGTQVQVNQATDRMAAEWQSFSIGAGHSVRFVQPSAQSVALNRVLGPDASVIQGQLSANGQVFLLNPNGVLFSPTAQVDVGGLVASTLRLSNEDFLAGRWTFSGDSTQSVVNQGALRTAAGGYVGLIAARVVNDGTISTPRGSALLGAGRTVTLDLGGPVKLQVDQGALDAQVANGGVIEAAGGHIMLTARAAGDLGSAVINQTGHVEATTLGTDARGHIVLSAEGGAIVNTGTVSASGERGGSIEARARALIDAGQWQATGSAGAGGQVTLAATQHLEQTAASRLDASGQTAGGQVRATSGGAAWLSGQLRADSSGGQGGDVSVTAQDLTVAGAALTADGTAGGGRVRVGGGWQGADADLANAARTTVTQASTLSASATQAGHGGTVVVWSEGGTGAAAHIAARGAGAGGNGGAVEVSSRGRLAYAATVDVSAAQGQAGRVLLDPKNIVIDNSAPPSYSVMSLADPSPGAADGHGSGGVAELANGNIVVSSPTDDAIATNAGAVRLYRPDGTLVSTLTGSTAGDAVGNGGITALAGGNFVARSQSWDNVGATDAGAVTWGHGTTGVSGIVSAANSLVGTTTSDRVGNSPIIALANGNYLVHSSNWNNAGAASAGAVTWGSGATGVAGAVSAANSLVGSTTGDRIGNHGVTLLANGNYLVRSAWWDNAGAADAGAVTWGSGTAGVKGTVSATNSLVGGSAGDLVGQNAPVLLANGNAVLNTPTWDNAGAADAGAVTWMDAATGRTGAIGAANSLVGTRAGDEVGIYVVALENGNYVVSSPRWNAAAATAVGAATWASGATGLTGTISAGNSLVGSASGDGVGWGIQGLANGHYVVTSSSWSAGRGAATWGNGTSGTVGTVSAANSLVGGVAGHAVGSQGITALANGNYVVLSPFWDNGAIQNAGAVTWRDGSGPTTGTVSAANSLVGGTANDNVGLGPSGANSGVAALANGNYVVLSSNWHSGANPGAGAVTWGNGTTGVSGTISAANSLVGSTAYDGVGAGLVELANGNYVIRSWSWDNGATADVGAVTWASGTGPLTGTISQANSLIGSTAADYVGAAGVVALANGNYVVRSQAWDNGSAANAGAATWGNGLTGISGVVSEANSLVGTQTGDQVGVEVMALDNGNYLVRSADWANGSAVRAGALTWGNGTTGIAGVVSEANSLVGSRANDLVGSSVTQLANGNYVAVSQVWDNGAVADAGAVTWGNGSTGVVGVVSAANSLVGSSTSDRVGAGGITQLGSGRYAVSSMQWSGQAGAVTLVDAATGLAGTVGAANSMVGSVPGARVGSRVTALSDGRAVVTSNSAMGQVDILGAGYTLPGLSYGANPSGDSVIQAAKLAELLGTGAAVTLQANNDITVSNAITVDNTAGDGGHLTLQAGRSILLNAGITTDNGNLTLVANDTLANGVVDAYRDAGDATIAMADGTALQAGTGTVSVQLRDGAGKTNRGMGAIMLATVQAADLAIDSAVLSGSLLAQGRVYDGTDLATLQPGDMNLSGLGFTASSNLSFNPQSARFEDKHVGVKTATAQDLLKVRGFNGAAASDILKSGSTVRLTGNATITARTLNVTATGVDKVYDGGAAATVAYGSDKIASDVLSVTGDASFGDKNVGSGKAISVTGLALGGADAGNYVLASTTASASADITARTLNVTATAADRVYDGTTDASVTYGSDKVASDVLSFTGTASFDDKNVGTGKTVTVAGLALGGADAGNYVLAAGPVTDTADITARTLNVTATGVDKVYDGGTAATVGYGSDKIASDVLSVTGDASFSDKNVGSGKAISVTGLALGGADAGNYVLASTTASASADITARTLNVTAAGQDKVYDGTMAATVGYASDKVVADDVVLSGSAVFADRNAGADKAIHITGLTLGGVDAGNYVLAATTAAATASITPRPVDLSGQRVADGTPVFLADVLSIGNLVAGDSLTLTGQASVASPAAGTYTTLASHSLVGSSPNYALTGGVRLVIAPAPRAPEPPAGPVLTRPAPSGSTAAPPHMQAVIASATPGSRPPQAPDAITRGSTQDDTGVSSAPLNAPGSMPGTGLPLQVIQGGIRLPSEAAGSGAQEER